MDGGDQNLGNGGSRWNPTKEQIDMLEGLYKQGLRTPSAEQIQQITNRLREFGHIEGKNVFYWFQNHKARQRHKQKQENSAFFNRIFHSTTSAFPPYHNVVCSPCYIPPTQSDLGLYLQYPKVPLPAAGCFKRRLVSEVPMEKSKQPTSQRYNKVMQNSTRRYGQELQYNKQSCHQETLDLFPMHPTGILQAKNGILENEKQSFTPNTSENDSWILGGNHEKEAGNNNGGGDHPYFDFFCGKYN